MSGLVFDGVNLVVEINGLLEESQQPHQKGHVVSIDGLFDGWYQVFGVFRDGLLNKGFIVAGGDFSQKITDQEGSPLILSLFEYFQQDIVAYELMTDNNHDHRMGLFEFVFALVGVLEEFNDEHSFFFSNFSKIFIFFPKVDEQIFLDVARKAGTEVDPSVVFFFIQPFDEKIFVDWVHESVPQSNEKLYLYLLICVFVDCG
jgi:hypothetical protein